MDQALNSQKTPHTSPLRASYGMSFVSILMKNDRVIKGFYCIYLLSKLKYKHTLVDNLDVVGASVGAAPITSSFSTYHLASVNWAKTTVRWYEKHLSCGIWCGLFIRGLTVYIDLNKTLKNGQPDLWIHVALPLT